jgi:alcohol dehydrogenase class IV
LKITFEIADQKVKNKINNILNLFGVYTIDDFIKKWKELMKTCDLNTNIFSYGLTSNDKELIISKVNPERMNNHPVELSRQNLKQIVSEMFYIFS